MIRTQLYLDKEIHARLRDLARRQGRTLSELVRDALTRAYGMSGPERRIKTLRDIEGLWRGRKDIGGTAAVVRRLRRDTHRIRRKG